MRKAVNDMTYSAHRSPADSAALTSRPLVLVVDDDPNLSSLILMLLEEMAIPALALPNADEGLAWLQAHPQAVALLLTDVHMPGSLDGAELAQLCASRWPEVPVVVMSGDADGSCQGAGQFLRKPFDLQHLAMLIQATLAGNQRAAVSRHRQ
ncbi:MAG: DNA-binding transcriptional regulator NtrC [Pseudomonas citronellolis]|nr:MAG: DNA-binding transcriptional regulator NtrC [Pseudomonas citronellolis]